MTINLRYYNLYKKLNIFKIGPIKLRALLDYKDWIPWLIYNQWQLTWSKNIYN